jgi:hypothetical protein
LENEYRVELPVCECGEEVHPGEDHCHVCLTGYPYDHLWGDGIHDDTNGIQALLDEGISIPAGCYRISEPLILTNNTTISGVTFKTRGAISLSSYIVSEGVSGCAVINCAFINEDR